MSVINEESENASETENTASPVDGAIVLDLGKKKRKLIKKLRKGKGKLIDQVEDHLDELRAAGAMSESAQPVIVVVAEKPTKTPWM